MKDLVKIENQNGKLVVSSRIIAEQLYKDHQDVKKKIKEVLEIGTEYFPVQNTNRGKIVEDFLVAKDGFILLCMNYQGYNDFKRAYIKRFNEMEKALKNINEVEKVEVNFKALKYISDLMGYNENSKAIMSNKLIDSLGLEQSLKIEYTKSNGVLKPLTQLLKENNIELSSIKVNKKLLELGIIEEKTRKSTKGIKKYKSIKNMEFGENQVSPKNPKETQPLYYEEKFKELMELVKKC